MRRGTTGWVDFFSLLGGPLWKIIYDDILWNMFVAYLRLWGVDLYTFLCCEACSFAGKNAFPQVIKWERT